MNTDIEVHEMLTASLESIEQRQLFRFRHPHITELAYTIEQGTRHELTKVRLRSVHSEQPAIIEFYNSTSERVRAIWINFNGHEVAYSIIEPNQSKRYHSYVSHPWIVRDVVHQSRLCVNNCEVVFGKTTPTAVTIMFPPLLEWTIRTHRFFASEFQRSIQCLLLCQRRLACQKTTIESSCSCVRDFGSLTVDEDWVHKNEANFCGETTLGDVPSFLLRRVAYFLSLQYQTAQSLSRGVDAAQDLSPVELPSDVPLSEFCPDRQVSIEMYLASDASTSELSESEDDEE